MDPPPRLPVGRTLHLIRCELDSALDPIDRLARLERTTGVPENFQGRADKQCPLYSLIVHCSSPPAQVFRRAEWRGPQPGGGSRIVWYGTPVRAVSVIAS
jgi:hypothetical protein